VRLVSMLHAAALADLERGEHFCARGSGEAEDFVSTAYDLIDPNSLDSQTLETLKGAEDRVELLFEWIQQLIVENMDTGVLSIAPPILSRCFQELANGMVAFHNATKIAYIPIPFPYAQTCDWLLLMNTVMVPIVTSQWVTNELWAVVFTIMHVSVLWSLNLVALEIENPFGRDANDMDGRRMQDEINRHLVLLLQPGTERTTRLSSSFDLKRHSATSSSFDLKRGTTLAGAFCRGPTPFESLDDVEKGRAGESEATAAELGEYAATEKTVAEEKAQPTAHSPLEYRTNLACSGLPTSQRDPPGCRECSSELVCCLATATPAACSQCGTRQAAGSNAVAPSAGSPASQSGSSHGERWHCTTCKSYLCTSCLHSRGNSPRAGSTDPPAQNVLELFPVVPGMVEEMGSLGHLIIVA